MTAIGDAYLDVVSTLTSAGFTVAESSAAIRPPCVVVDPPDISTISATLVELTFPVSPVVAPPGDRRALDELLDAVDTIAGLFPISSSTAAIYTAGPQDLPSYRLTVPMTIRRVDPLPPPFDPLDLNPSLWVDPSDTSTITEVAGKVSQLDDKSGNGNHLTQPTAALQPTTGYPINGLNALFFNGDSLRNDVLSLAQPFTVFTVAYPRVFGRDFLWQNSANTSYVFQYDQATIRLYFGHTLISPLNTLAIQPALVTATVDAYTTLRYQGTLVASGYAGTNGLDGFAIATSWYGEVAEIIAVDGTLSAAQIAATENYLAGKWGITLP